MNVDELRELVEISLATYNVTPHVAHGDLSPMQALDQFAADPDHIIKTLSKNRRSQLTWLNVEETRKIRGGLRQQRRPYIHLEGVDYNNEVLRGAPSMVGQILTLVYDPTEDARKIAAYTKNGRELGLLKAKGQWAIAPHTFDLRREIMALRTVKEIFYQEHDDPVQVYITHLNEKALHQKSARGRLVTAQNLSKNTQPKKGVTIKRAEKKAPSQKMSEPKKQTGIQKVRTYSKRKARNI